MLREKEKTIIVVKDNDVVESLLKEKGIHYKKVAIIELEETEEN